MKDKIQFLGKIMVVVLLSTILGCNSWLDLEPDNDRTTASYWQSKEEVENVLVSCYVKMRGCLEKYVEWGELRGDALTLGLGVTANEEKIKKLDILFDNPICKWNDFYSIIGYANSVIKYGPQVLERDETFSKELEAAYSAEATVLRALSYFWLVRTFGEVPLVTEPYVDDSEPFFHKKASEREILDLLIADLKRVIPKCKPGYGATPADNWEDKGRVTRWAAYALLADICLWDEKYQDCVDACDAIMASGKYNLVGEKDWMTLFSEGNTTEGIFELQWKGSINQGNDLYKWFYSDDNKPRLIASEKTLELFQQFAERDLRYLGVTVVDKEDKRIWKYIGTGIHGDGGIVRPSTQRDANWIFYRYADVLLMRAEALTMTDEGGFATACEVVGRLRERAGYTIPLSAPENRQEALNMLMDERQREFVAEGKRWFDILRVARRNNWEYKDYLLSALLDGIPAKDRPMWEAKLSDVNSYYLPIHKDEIDANAGMLKQNPYYEDIEY